MHQHFNIAQQKVVNPFEKVIHVTTSKQTVGCGIERLRTILNRTVSVTTRKMGEIWVILYPIEMLDFVTIITWRDVTAGKFLVAGHTVYFRIEEDLLICW